MLYVLLRVLGTVAFSHLLRFSQVRTRSPMQAAAVNYLVAAVGSALWTAAAGFRWHTPTLVLGALAGITYVSSLLLVFPAMRRSGVSVTGAVLQLALMVPVAFAIWRFDEQPNAYQAAGIAVTLIALPVLSATSAVETEPVRRGFSGLTALLFLSSGFSQVLMKEFSVAALPADLPLFSTALFVAATVCTYAWCALVPERKTPVADEPFWSEGPVGLALGVVNLLQLLALLLALRALPAVVVFPVSAALGIVTNAAASMLFWRERPPPAGWIGILLAVGAVVLLNLK